MWQELSDQMNEHWSNVLLHILMGKEEVLFDGSRIQVLYLPDHNMGKGAVYFSS